jgi:hypothetical protein
LPKGSSKRQRSNGQKGTPGGQISHQRMPNPYPRPVIGVGENGQLPVHLSRYIKGNYLDPGSPAEAVPVPVAPQHVVPTQPVSRPPIAAVRLGSEAELRMAIDWLQRSYSTSDMEAKQQKAVLLHQLRAVSNDTRKQA